jgi:hypothetical protein
MRGGFFAANFSGGIHMKSLIAAAVAGVALLCAGCSSMDPQAAKVTKFGPQNVLQQPVEEPDLVSVISEGGQSFVVQPDAPAAEFSKALDQALRGFYSGDQSAAGQEERRLRRNRVQDRLILASNDGCETFKTALQRKQATRNFEFGTATVLFGAAGAVASGVNAAKNLAALSGVSGGLRAEYNRDYFAEVAAHVIAKGINSRRKEILNAIATGQAKPMSQYTLEAALADIVSYHGACSLVGGLEFAEGAITKVDGQPIGLDVLKAISKPVP